MDDFDCELIENNCVDVELLEVDYWRNMVDNHFYFKGESYTPYHNYNMFIPVVVPILRTLESIFG